MEINETLKELRNAKGYTQSDVAKLLNMSKTGYASWEQGLSEPNIAQIKALCALYDVSADYLLGIDEKD